jgi:hypothetical protein
MTATRTVRLHGPFEDDTASKVVVHYVYNTVRLEWWASEARVEGVLHDVADMRGPNTAAYTDEYASPFLPGHFPAWLGDLIARYMP